MNIENALLAVGYRGKFLQDFSSAILGSLSLFGISDRNTFSHFIGQCAVESRGFTVFEENLRYTTPEVLERTFSRVRSLPPSERSRFLNNPEGLANLVYSGKFGNGDFSSGDGWRYRGRGAIQLTFADNYRRIGEIAGRPYLEEPGLLATPSDAILSAAAYFFDKGLHLIGQSDVSEDTVRRVTRKINPALFHLPQRFQATIAASEAL